MFRSKAKTAQQALWIPTQDIVQTPAHSFYDRLDHALDTIGFADQVRELCQPFYDDQGRGRPGVDPFVYFKMLMVGFFENLASERGIAARCQDSLAIRSFLRYDLTEPTPDHSTLSVIRTRLGDEVFEQAFALVLQALKRAGLLRGKNLGIDASTLEANASMRSLEKRLTGESYAAYVRGLAAADGVNIKDPAAVQRYDRTRKDKRLPNAEWHNPHDVDAKIGKTKRGSFRMIHKAEHTVDLETGAIVDVDILPGDQSDSADLAARVAGIQARLRATLGEGEAKDAGDHDHTTASTTAIATITTDKGYYDTEQLRRLQAAGIETVMPDRIENRRVDRLNAGQHAALRAARASVQTKEGRALGKLRAERVERTFAHVLDCGGARRTTLRGLANIRKRYLIQAMTCNLSLLMRTLIGIGTTKQAVAARLAALLSELFRRHRAMARSLRTSLAIRSADRPLFAPRRASHMTERCALTWEALERQKGNKSTAC